MRSLAELPRARAVLLDVAPRALLAMAGDRLPGRIPDALRRFRYGAGVCKADFALSGPVPWASEAARRAGTLHLGGTFAEIAAAEAEVAAGRHPAAPYVLVTQPAVADPTRSPAGTHTLWAYCHVPAGSTVDMTARIEAQIERFAPGFRDLILARHVRTAADEEAANPNYVGGDIAAGMQTVWQTVARPVPRWNPYRTPLPRRVPVLVVHPAAARRARPVRRTGRADRAARRLRHPAAARCQPGPAQPGRHGRGTAVTASRTARLPGHRLTAPRLTALLLAGLIVLLTGVVVAQSVTRHHTGSHRTAAEGTALVLALWAVAAVGLVVAWHQRANPIGWLLLAMPVLLLLTFASDSYDQAYRLGQHALPVLGPAALVMAQLFFVPFIALPLIIWLFPDGRPPPGRWRFVFWACPVLLVPALVSILVLTGEALAAPHLRTLADGELPRVENTPPLAGILSLIFFGSLLISWLCALAYQIASWRRSTGERRQQLKWLMSGAAICGLSAAASFASTAALWEVLLLGIVALPVSIGIGILKYRLYDIDRIISRTLAYALVTGLLVGVYAGLVLLATEVLGFTSSVAVAAATLAAAALFNPVRRRVQRVVDRRFNRARYDADAAVAAFAARTSGAVALDELRADLLGVIGHALEPAHQALWLSRDER